VAEYPLYHGGTVRLQLAVDLVEMAEARRLLDLTADLVDIVEVGTPLIIREGVRAVTELKSAYPHNLVLADLKIMDAGGLEARIGFDAGADIVTVLGAAHEETLQGALASARASGGEIMVDLIAVPDPAARARDVDALGADYVCVHTAFDVQASGADPLLHLQHVGPVLRRSRLAVAGGIAPATARAVAAHRPDIVVVGGAIACSQDPARAAREIRSELRRAAAKE